MKTSKLMTLTLRTLHISMQQRRGPHRFHYAESCWPADGNSPAESPENITLTYEAIPQALCIPHCGCQKNITHMKLYM